MSASATIEQVFRAESTRIVATLVRMLRDVSLAEELAQDALVAALERWPFSGIPDNPGAWLMLTARNAALDRLRHRRIVSHHEDAVGWHEALLRSDRSQDLEESPERIADDQLRLVFTCCHPSLSREAQVALTLRLLGGLSTEEIARAFLVSEPTVAQRIVRAKRTIEEQGLRYEVPAISELAERLPAVLEVLYLIFNEGYAASKGDALIRKDLCDEALRLGRLVASLTNHSEVLGLLALMELQASRRDARVDETGELVLLADQDRGRWDGAAIGRGLALRDAARRSGVLGPYLLQAEIAALHAIALDFASTDWLAIADVYEKLRTIAPSPVVDLNRAVAIGFALGPAEGLAAIDALENAPALRDYHLLPSTRADFLRRLGRLDEAATAYRRALALVGNDKERAFLERRLAECSAR